MLLNLYYHLFVCGDGFFLFGFFWLLESVRSKSNVHRQVLGFYASINDSANCFPLIHTFVADNCVETDLCRRTLYFQISRIIHKR